MSTINPLFLDSTKPIGDKVVTNVELLGIVPRDGDSIFCEVTDQFGFAQRFAMKVVETKKSIRYTSEIWLKYQHEVRYRFVIMADGEEVFTSESRQTRAGHIISEKWEPCFKVEPVKPKKEPRPSTQEIKPAIAKPRIKTDFFDQMKSVIDDLW